VVQYVDAKGDTLTVLHNKANAIGGQNECKWVFKRSAISHFRKKVVARIFVFPSLHTATRIPGARIN
jgi:hypothetical protein